MNECYEIVFAWWEVFVRAKQVKRYRHQQILDICFSEEAAKKQVEKLRIYYRGTSKYIYKNGDRLFYRKHRKPFIRRN